MEEVILKQNLELLSCEEFSTWLGIKKSTLYVWLCKKQLPPHLYRKLGRKPIFIKSEVERWILDGCKMNTLNVSKDN